MSDREHRYLPLKRLRESPTNPRRTFDAEGMVELTESVARHGVLQPILVRPIVEDPASPASSYEVVAGARRYRAAAAADLQSVPCLVATLTDREVLEIQIVENLQRKDIEPVDEAEAIAQLWQAYEADEDAVAKAVNKSRAWVRSKLQIADIEPELRERARECGVSASHLLILAGLSPSEQLAVAPRLELLATLAVDAFRPAVRSEARVRSATDTPEPPDPPAEPPNLPAKAPKRASAHQEWRIEIHVDRPGPGEDLAEWNAWVHSPSPKRYSADNPGSLLQEILDNHLQQ